MSVRVIGTPGAAGIAVGPAWIHRTAPPGAVSGAVRPVGEGPSASTGGEGARAALERTDVAGAIRAASVEASAQLEALAERVRAMGRDEEAGIFEAQSLMAIDTTMLDEALRRVEAGEDAAEAVQGSADAAAALLASLDDELLAARAADVRDVGARLVRILRGEEIALPAVPSIAVADDLPPSITAEIPAGFLLGICLEGGSATAHAVILARGLGVPAVVGAAGVVGAVAAVGPAGSATPTVAVDGGTGEVIVAPSASEAEAFRMRTLALAERRAAAERLRDRPCATSDGHRVLLVANIGSPDDAPRAIAARAEGVGLFRTEFLFMQRRTPPTESEQVTAYRRVLEAFGPQRPVVIRLADIGGDKQIPYLKLPAEANPFLGVRAIRLAYGSRDLLLTQLRAIWRAGAMAGVTPHVMAPMVATVEDVDLLLSLRDEARAGLAATGEPCADRMVTGIMVEVPSAALLAPELARRIDFFSIGTNDLTQYLFAADRGNAALRHFQDALHPAVLRAVAGIVAGAKEAGIPVAVCGELAGDPAGALVLTGLGVAELSADAGSLDGVRAALASASKAELDELAAKACTAPGASEVRAMCGSLLNRTARGPITRQVTEPSASHEPPAEPVGPTATLPREDDRRLPDDHE